jgi:hypothetical protein
MHTLWHTNSVKKALFLSLCVAFSFGFSVSWAQEGPQPGVKLERELHFDGLSLSGKYQTPAELSIRAQEEKVLRDLIGMRTHFLDRVREEMERK